MRRIVLQMMTTLDGRLDDPMAWASGVDDAQYCDIDEVYASFDTVIVGRSTYNEMAAYWPGALDNAAGGPVNQAMARRMHAYRKLVITRSEGPPLSAWHNVDRIVAPTDDDLKCCLEELKAQSGADVHLAGGASLAQSVIALGLVDEFYFFVNPVASRGAVWFERLQGSQRLHFREARAYPNGVVRLHYLPSRPLNGRRPDDFTELLGQDHRSDHER
ncbi:MAG TPA: dihydrofolate reductase family protein [Longimicrobiales bacterium]|nr:dihydrofolate reductase family protein [Longimicrobiales bacterium]